MALLSATAAQIPPNSATQLAVFGEIRLFVWYNGRYMLNRMLYPQLLNVLQPGKVVVVYGPRRVGKTYLLNQLIDELSQSGQTCKYANGESLVVQQQLSAQIPEKLYQFLDGAEVLVVDEAQQIPQIGLNLKLLIDTYPHLKIVASGSASFSLSQEVGEPLTGRKKTLTLYPVSIQELVQNYSTEMVQATVVDRCIYGGYPELFNLDSVSEQQDYLEDLVDSYLFKDILELEQIKGAKKLYDLLTLLAFQIGKEVSLSELGNRLDLHKDTVARYLDLLEKSFVVFNLRGYSRNLRKEISKTSRYYFWDMGIRNALIRNYNPPNMRNDIGAIWENFLVMERIKKLAYQNKTANYYFWRTYDQKEIDWIEERDGLLRGFEMKWGSRLPKAPEDWLATYANASYEVVNRENYLEFVS